MKKAVVFVVLVMLVIGFCAAQSVNNDAQRFVGTWVSETGGITYVLNANGTGTSSGRSIQSENGNIFWGVSSSGRLCIILADGDDDSASGIYYFSPDGKRMILAGIVFQKK